MTTDTRSSKHRLLDLLMVTNTGADLRTYVTKHRADGNSWRRVASDVSRITGEETTDQNLLAWFGAELAEAEGGTE